METRELVKNKADVTEIQLVKGTFTPNEASHIIMNLINEKIKFHKIERLQIWEGNHNCKTAHLDNRIEELEKEKEIVKEIISKARDQGQQLKINGFLEISFI